MPCVETGPGVETRQNTLFSVSFVIRSSASQLLFHKTVMRVSLLASSTNITFVAGIVPHVFWFCLLLETADILSFRASQKSTLMHIKGRLYGSLKVSKETLYHDTFLWFSQHTPTH